MQMTEEEICVSYREAKYQGRQISILAQLNQCDPQRIKAILARHGEKPRMRTAPAGIIKTFSDRYREVTTGESSLAAALRISSTADTVRCLRNGVRLPGTEVLIRICRSYNVSADWMLGLDEQDETG